VWWLCPCVCVSEKETHVSIVHMKDLFLQTVHETALSIRLDALT